MREITFYILLVLAIAAVIAVGWFSAGVEGVPRGGGGGDSRGAWQYK